jgi:hypothetical protein
MVALIAAVALYGVGCAAPETPRAAEHAPPPVVAIPASGETTAATGINKWTVSGLPGGARVLTGWNDDRVVSDAVIRTMAEGSLRIDYGRDNGYIIVDRNSRRLTVHDGHAGLAASLKAQAYFTQDVQNRPYAAYDACTLDVLAAAAAVATGASRCAPIVEAALAGGPLPAAGIALACAGASLTEGIVGWKIGLDCFVGSNQTKADYDLKQRPADKAGDLVATCESGDCDKQKYDISESNVPDGTGVEIDGSSSPDTSVEQYPGGFEPGSFCADCWLDGSLEHPEVIITGGGDDDDDDESVGEEHIAECIYECL